MTRNEYREALFHDDPRSHSHVNGKVVYKDDTGGGDVATATPSSGGFGSYGGGGSSADPFADYDLDQVVQAYYSGELLNGQTVSKTNLAAKVKAENPDRSQQEIDRVVNQIIADKPSASERSGSTFTPASSFDIVAGSLAGSYDEAAAVSAIARNEGISERDAQKKYDEIVSSNSRRDGTGYLADMNRAIESAQRNGAVASSANPDLGSSAEADIGASPIVGQPGAGIDRTTRPPGGGSYSTGGSAGSGSSGGGGGSSAPTRKYPKLSVKELYEFASAGEITPQDLHDELTAMGYNDAEINLQRTKHAPDWRPGAGTPIGTIGSIGYDQQNEQIGPLPIFPERPGEEVEFPGFEPRETQGYMTPVTGTSPDTTGLQLTGSLGNGTAVGFGSQAGMGYDLNYYNTLQQAREMAGLAPGENVTSEFMDIWKTLQQYPDLQQEPQAFAGGGSINYASRIGTGSNFAGRNPAGVDMQPNNLMVKRPALLIDMASGQPLAMIGEGGKQEQMQEMGNRIAITPTQKDVSLGREQMASPFRGTRRPPGFHGDVMMNGGSSLASRIGGASASPFGVKGFQYGGSISFGGLGSSPTFGVYSGGGSRHNSQGTSTPLDTSGYLDELQGNLIDTQQSNLTAQEGAIGDTQEFYDNYYEQQQQALEANQAYDTAYLAERQSDIEAVSALSQAHQAEREASLAQEQGLTLGNLDSRLQRTQQEAQIREEYRMQERQAREALESTRNDIYDYRYGLAGLPTAYERASRDTSHQLQMQQLDQEQQLAEISLAGATEDIAYAKELAAAGYEEDARRLEEAALQQQVSASQALSDLDRQRFDLEQSTSAGQLGIERNQFELSQGTSAEQRAIDERRIALEINAAQLEQGGLIEELQNLYDQLRSMGSNFDSHSANQAYLNSPQARQIEQRISEIERQLQGAA